MIKLIWISDKDIKGFGFWFLKRIFHSKDYYRLKGEKVRQIIDNESADFILVDIQGPANTDLVDRLWLCYINRLRVSVFTLKPSRSRIFKFFFPIDLVKTIAENSVINYRPLPEEKS